MSDSAHNGRARTWRVCVPASLSGERLDKAIAHLCPPLSRGLARRLLEAGAVRVDGQRVRNASRAVRPGAWLDVGYDASVLEGALDAGQREDSLVVAAEGQGWVVIDKAPGVHVQATAFGAAGTLEERVQRWLERRSPSPGRRPYVGVLHRLDADTSGLVVMATDPEVASALAQQVRVHSMTRVYVALIHGIPGELDGSIDLPLTKRIQGRVRVGGVHDAMPAVTHYVVRAVYPSLGVSQVCARLETGRQHQVRVHFASTIGPIVGDRLYGRGTSRGTRLLLHAQQLSFDDPGTGKRVHVRSTPGADFFDALPNSGGTQPVPPVARESGR